MESLSSKTLKTIADRLDIPENLVDINFFRELLQKRIIQHLRFHPLAHLFRVMEAELRRLTKNPFFQIRYEPLGTDDKLEDVCEGRYYIGKNQQGKQAGRMFIVYYHPHLNEKQLRVCVAHELGHLYLLELYNFYLLNEKKEPITEARNFLSEPLSSLFALFLIDEKDAFYRDGENINSFCHNRHNRLEDILETLVLMRDKLKFKRDTG